MEALKNLAFLILISQIIASIILAFSSVLDASTFERYAGQTHLVIPGLRKIIRLFRYTSKNYMMGFYFMSLVFVMFSYIGILLLIIQILKIAFNI